MNRLSAIKYHMVKKSAKWSDLKINNIILKIIKEYAKVTHHREKWVWTKNGI